MQESRPTDQDNLAQAARLESNCFQAEITCSTGAMARPERIEQAIIMPGVIVPWIASKAPAPRDRATARELAIKEFFRLMR